MLFTHDIRRNYAYDLIILEKFLGRQVRMKECSRTLNYSMSKIERPIKLQPARVGRRRATALRDASSRVNRRNDENKPPIRKLVSTALKTSSQMERLGSLHDPQDAYDYDLEIYKATRQDEMNDLPLTNYWPYQEVTPSMRFTLIDWLSQIHLKLKMHTETLFLTVSLIDRYLSKNMIPSDCFQLLGCTALFVAMKIEESTVIPISDLVYYSGECFTAEKMKQMEVELICCLNFCLHVPTPTTFLVRFIGYSEADVLTSFLAYYLDEVVLLLPQFIGVKPSLIAASVLCLSRCLLSVFPFWDNALQLYTTYSIEDIEPIVQSLFIELKMNQQLVDSTIKKKFSSPEVEAISSISLPDELVLK